MGGWESLVGVTFSASTGILFFLMISGGVVVVAGGSVVFKESPSRMIAMITTVAARMNAPLMPV
jgi:hypothetical protein